MVTGPAVFFFPHQDDEILTQGPSIQGHLAAGREVICVAMSDGQASGVRTVLRNEGYDLSEAAFSKARDREVLDCLTRLGVSRGNIYFENIEDGGSYNLARVKKAMRAYIAKFGPGSYKTHSWMDAHRDHYMLGRALDEMNRAGEVPNGDARFLRSWRYPEAPTPGGGWNNATDIPGLKHAGAAYGVWDPDRIAISTNMQTGPRYSIGYKSVGEQEFIDVANEGRVWTHMDSSNYTASGRTAANNWLQSKGHYAYL